jgi:hypothetical protein
MTVDFVRHLAAHDFIHHPEENSELLIIRDGMHVEQSIDEFAQAIQIIKGFRYDLSKGFALLLGQLDDLLVALIKGFFHGDLLVIWQNKTATFCDGLILVGYSISYYLVDLQFQTLKERA